MTSQSEACETLYELVLEGEVLGKSALEERDASWGVAQGRFTPTAAFSKVEAVFALFTDASVSAEGERDEAKLKEYYAERDRLGLAVRDATGTVVPTRCIHIETANTPCRIEIHVGPEFFPDDEPATLIEF